MMVRVNDGKGHNFALPISLLVLDQTFDALEDLAWVVEKLFLRWAVPIHSHHNHHHERFPYWANLAEAPSRVLSLCRELIDELRSYGRWRMLEVEKKPRSQECTRHQDRVRVYIDFI